MADKYKKPRNDKGNEKEQPLRKGLLEDKFKWLGEMTDYYLNNPISETEKPGYQGIYARKNDCDFLGLKSTFKNKDQN